ncbi:MotA/TolQ/ExbB proton channel family protein [endosymbiont of Lamellibrachia barhami]|uniref:MotA/TolQ/ExbB proton channel family protein n=1 Tax=endosymbiont of Lamellibrachia barhami TaxID=205975 RepID=UPI0015A7FC01|nr:MotA/TolQ/ExbB proton channel family protein [endosymbiont of Lamellibrachia barhami]
MARPAENQHHPESFASQFETVSGLSSWLAWLVVMVAICVVLVVTFLLGQISAGMYFVIFSLAIGLVYKGYQDAKFLDREMKLASEQVKILERVDDFESFLDQAKKSVFRSHIDNLHTISLSHTEINQDNLIEVLHTRLMARNRVIELFSSILITLGLIGTIVGLIIMMDGMTEVMLQGGDDLLARLADPEGGPLSGLGIAFYTTLLGAVFGGVILRVLTSVVDANIMRYTAHLAELTEVYVLPYMRRTAKKTHEMIETTAS